MNQSRYKAPGRTTLVVIAVITLFAAYLCRDLKFDYNFENFFPEDDPDLGFYHDYRKKHGYENEFVLIGITNSKGIFSKEFLSRIRQLTDTLKKLPAVEQVISPSTLKQVIITPLGPVSLPFLHTEEPERYADDSALIFNTPWLTGSFFEKNGKSVSIYLKTKEGISKNKSDTLYFRIKELLEAYSFEKTHIAGKLKAQYVYVDKIQDEFIMFFVSSFLLVVLFLFLAYRSFHGIWLPVLIILLSITWTLGFMSLMNKPLDLMTVLLPTMLFIIAMSDVVHILSRYIECLKEGKKGSLALGETIRDVGLPTFITLLTTVVGFLSLLWSNLKPLRDFGIYTSVGAGIAFLLSFTILPAFMLYSGKSFDNFQKRQDYSWAGFLHKLLLRILRNRKYVLAGTAILIILSIAGFSRIRSNNFLLEALANDNELRQDFSFFEEKYAGVRPFEMAISVNDSSRTLLDRVVLQELEKTEQFLEKEYGIGFVYSPVSLVKSVYQSLHNGNPEYYKLPETEDERNECLTIIGKNDKRKELRAVLESGFRKGRISGKMKDIGSAEIKNRNRKLEDFYKHSVKPGVFGYKLTGAATLIDKNSDDLVMNMLYGLIGSVLLVACIIAALHRSWKMVAICLVPNIIPMLITGGIMGFAGIDLKSSTAIIFSIAFGIATDDTIHLLGRLKIELNKGRSMLYAIKRTYISTGKAVLLTSLILSGGFLTLILSDFESTFYFGLLVSLTLFIAVITDLLLLPLLLLWLAEKKAGAK